MYAGASRQTLFFQSDHVTKHCFKYFVNSTYPCFRFIIWIILIFFITFLTLIILKTKSHQKCHCKTKIECATMAVYVDSLCKILIEVTLVTLMLQIILCLHFDMANISAFSYNVVLLLGLQYVYSCDRSSVQRHQDRFLTTALLIMQVSDLSSL